MSRLFVSLLIMSMLPLPVAAEEKGDGGPKVVTGMSILGNNDAPKSLYIVPWKSSEIGVKKDLASSLLDDDMSPVDKTVFSRELYFYKISSPE